MSEDFFANLDGDLDSMRVCTKPEYRSPVERFKEGCPKCGGSGKFTSWSGRTVGDCFACKGAGKRSFKTSPQAREKAAMARNEKRIEANNEKIAWQEAHKAELDWVQINAERGNDFAFSLRESLNQYGTLTDRQIQAVRNGIEKAAQRKAERAANAPTVDTAGIDRLKEAFDKAIAYTADKGLKLSPKITISGMTISPAKAHSANPGALYVKDGSTYLGKVQGGRFFASRDCTPEDTAKIQSFIADPAEAAKVYGQTTGTCCICNATLRSEWKFKGIGPICAEKFGWA